MATQTKTYFAIANVAEARAYTAVMTGPARDLQHPDGWTYQEATGAHGSILLETSTEEYADDAVRIYNDDIARSRRPPPSRCADCRGSGVCRTCNGGKLSDCPECEGSGLCPTCEPED